ncbi:MAG: RNA-binding cell elongation regulator Jag/EloR [Christensenellales bacterium]|jgi:spoIIIJ-associated protein
MAYTEYIGRSVEDAIENAKARLGLTQDEITIEILDPGSKGFLGIGNRLARIRVKAANDEEEDIDILPREDANKETPPIPPPAAPVMVPRQVILPNLPKEDKPLSAESAPIMRSVAGTKAGTKSDQPEETSYEEPAGTLLDPEEDKEAASTIAFLGSLAMLMGAEGLEYRAYAQEDGTLRIDVAGDTNGILIGHRGETLNALQLIVNLAANQGSDEDTGAERRRIAIDVGGYRQRREKTLARLARRLAMKAIRTKHKVSLEPMNSYERRIIHSALSDMRDVTTLSQGEDPNRFVVIYPKQQNRRRY